MLSANRDIDPMADRLLTVTALIHSFSWFFPSFHWARPYIWIWCEVCSGICAVLGMCGVKCEVYRRWTLDNISGINILFLYKTYLDTSVPFKSRTLIYILYYVTTSLSYQCGKRNTLNIKIYSNIDKNCEKHGRHQYSLLLGKFQTNAIKFYATQTDLLFFAV